MQGIHGYRKEEIAKGKCTLIIDCSYTSSDDVVVHVILQLMSLAI